VKRCLAKIDANRNYLHTDDPPCKKLPPRSTCPSRWVKRRTISLVDKSDTWIGSLQDGSVRVATETYADICVRQGLIDAIITATLAHDTSELDMSIIRR
jgi:hypothetical protein